MESKLLRPLSQAVALALAAGGAHAATITVTDGGDLGMISTCTLRQAIVSANTGSASGSTCAAGGGTNTIAFAPGLANSTITLANGELDVTSNLTLTGSGQTITAASGHRVMAIYSNTVTTVNLTDLTLVNGYCSQAGGGLSIGADSICSPVNDSKPSSHPHREAIPAVSPTGLNVTLSQVTISNNSSGYEAGGLFIKGSTVAINQSTVSGNTLNASGYYGAGGIYITGGSSVTITDSTISGNSASGSEKYLTGGVYVWDSQLTVTNSTITGNSASGDNDLAGGLSVSYPSSRAGIYDSTITGNTCTTSNVTAGGILVGADEGAGVLTLYNSILSGNTGTQADLGVYSSNVIAQSNLLGSILSSNYSGNGNIFSDAPGLGALANNGGPTLTMMPQAGSAALGAGNVALIPAGVTTDQRGTGYARVINDSLDVGSIETGTPAVTTATPTPALSRWAILALGGLLALFGLRKRKRAD